MYICEKILRGLIKKINSFKLVLFHIELALRMKYSKYEMESRKKRRQTSPEGGTMTFKFSHVDLTI